MKRAFCHHCGEICDEKVVYEREVFCCWGCKTVFQILKQNKLQNYYEISDYPGLKPEKDTNLEKEKYAFLDNKNIVERLVSFQEEQGRVTLKLPGIHCASCVWLLENLYRINTAVYSVRVNFLKRSAHIVFSHQKISLRKLVELLASIGYTPEINLETIQSGSQTSVVSSHLITQIAIAGFCFGNIMLISLPEYFGLNRVTESTFVRFFGYLNILLSLPVLFFSGREYFLSAWLGWKLRVINIDFPISLGISVLFIRSVYEVISESGSGYFDSLSGLIFFLLLGRAFQEYTYHHLSFEKDYRSYFPIAVNKIFKRKEIVVPIKEINSGDQMYIFPYQIIPVDSQLISPRAKIDFSFVTGESKPVIKKQKQYLPAGGKNGGDRIIVQAIKKFSDSSFMEMWNHDVFQKQEEISFRGMSYNTSLINRISKLFTIVVIGIASLGAAYWGWGAGDIGKGVEVFTAVLIVACPCALALSSPITLGLGLRMLSRNFFFIRNTETLERLFGIDVVVFDKTGTLTESSKESKRKTIGYEGKKLSLSKKKKFYFLSQHSSHPLSIRICNYFKNKILSEKKKLPSAEKVAIKNFKEHIGLGVTGVINGTNIRYGSKKFVCALDNRSLNDYKDIDKGNIVEKKPNNFSEVHVSINGVYYGVFKIIQFYRDGLAEVLSKLRKKYRLALLTGDSYSEEKFFKSYFRDRETLKFRQSPLDKLNWVQEKQRQNQKVLMLGDGLNDAGALKQSDVGIAFSEDIRGFSPACDAILGASAFPFIPNLLSFCRNIRKVIIISFMISFLYNFVGLYFSVRGELTPVIAALLMPISSVSVIWFIMVMMHFMAFKNRLIIFQKKLKNLLFFKIFSV